MVTHSLPSPPAEDNGKSGLSRKNTIASSIKTAKPTASRVSKRANSAAAIHQHDPMAHGVGMDGRHRRVWKACERCRVKKTKCDGEFPCKRCKDDGLVCTAGVRKKVEYKQLPKGYAEVLENTQFALIATVHKLYSMVRNSQTWELGEPELNDRGQPVIHNIAQRLGCIRPNSDVDLPVHSVFPEDEAGMATLARQLEEQPKHEGDDEGPRNASGREHRHHDRSSSSSEFDHSDGERDYSRAAFGTGSALTLSPQSFRTATNTDYEFAQTPREMHPHDFYARPLHGFHGSGIAAWSLPKAHQDNTLMTQFLQHPGLQDMNMLSPAVVDADFCAIKPEILSDPSTDVMLGMGDPMICSGFDGEGLRL